MHTVTHLFHIHDIQMAIGQLNLVYGMSVRCVYLSDPNNVKDMIYLQKND